MCFMKELGFWGLSMLPTPHSKETVTHEVTAILTLRARLAMLVVRSLPVGDEASTYSTILRPTPAWSEARGESTESPPVNCGGRAGPLCPTPAMPSPWLCPTPWSAGTGKGELWGEVKLWGQLFNVLVFIEILKGSIVSYLEGDTDFFIWHLMCREERTMRCHQALVWNKSSMF